MERIKDNPDDYLDDEEVKSLMKGGLIIGHIPPLKGEILPIKIEEVKEDVERVLEAGGFMTDEKLIEEIAQEGVNLYAFPNLWKRLNEKEKNNWRNWAKTKILTITDAYYKEKYKDYVKMEKNPMPSERE